MFTASSMNTNASTIPIIDGMRELAESSDAWLVDVWGVMHNGVEAFNAAAEACIRFREAGGYVVLLTNAPRPGPAVVRQIARIGVPQAAFDAVLSSGDVTRGLVTEWRDKHIHHLGPDRDRGIFEGIDIKYATSIEAEIVVVTGLFDDETETPDDYATTLKSLQRRNIAMLCANPDIRVERGDRIVYCAGALAEAYEKLGGDVVYAGKPHLPIYELALHMINDSRGEVVPKGRVIAIGDGLKTDIAGAAAAGLRSVFVASGLHVEGGRALSSELVDELFKDSPLERPVAAMQTLAW
ncbi:MAG: TIGR01459 family HAD-type hydrolase [Hyphomicrobiaceae bacterium]